MHVLARFDVTLGKANNLTVFSYWFPIRNRLKRNLMAGRNGYCNRHHPAAIHQLRARLDGFLEHTNVVALAQAEYYGIQYN
jgi:hypothetical protein